MNLSALTKDIRSPRQAMDRHLLRMHFQPLVDLRSGAVIAHEALVRPDAALPWRSPDALFEAARQEGLTEMLERHCVKLALREWMSQGAVGQLFVNLSASALIAALSAGALPVLLRLLREHGAAPQALVMELTEHELVSDVDALREAIGLIRNSGLLLALDDFGDGRSSLRLWSELKPRFVKVDKYFCRGVAQDGDKVQTLRALLQLAETFGSELVAEGIECADDLRVVRDLGLPLAQGFLIGRPGPALAQAPAPESTAVLSSSRVTVLPPAARPLRSAITAAQLVREQPWLDAQATHNDAFRLFEAHPEIASVALIDGERPVALLGRQRFIAQFVRPFFRELYGARPVLMHANAAPLVLDAHTDVDGLTEVLTAVNQSYLHEGFIVTEGGRFKGVGVGEELVRRVTESRIEAARHANPLTHLPGNIPTTEHIARLIDARAPFVAVYADLNEFKPYNDQYGYWRGDQMIQLLADTIMRHLDPSCDFAGHVGGDDFVVLMQCGDWHARCTALVSDFNQRALALYDEADRRAGGIRAEDRHGVVRDFGFTSVSLGAVIVAAGTNARAEDVASAAAAAKRQAKATRAALSVRGLHQPALTETGVAAAVADAVPA